MSTFIDLQSIGIQDGYMGFVQYERLNGNNRDFLWTHMWDIEIPTPPRVVAWPGIDIIRHRLQEVSLEISQEAMATQEIEIRGFKLIQSGGYDSSGSITLRFIDFEDQFIFHMYQDFMQAIGANRFKFHFRKEDFMIPIINIYFLNATRQPVRRYSLLGVVFTGGEVNTEMTTSPSDVRANVALNFRFQHHTVTIMNATPHIIY